MFTANGLFNRLLDAEGSVSGGIKVLGADVENSLPAFPLLNLMELFYCQMYFVDLIIFVNIDDVPEGGDNINANTAGIKERGTRLRQLSFGMTFIL